jgi:hypothetical protein
MSSDHKIRWTEFITSYVPTIIVWTVTASFLAMPESTPTSAMVQAILILIWSYAGHVFAHMISTEWPFNILNPHVYIHHEKSLDIPRWLELSIEAVVNFYGFFILYILQKLFKFKIFSTSLLIGAAFLYIIMHILDYSIFGKTEHTLHHTKTFCNYDPEFFDTLFDTRCEPEKPYTNMAREIPHAIFAFSLAGILKYTYHLD